LHYLPSPKQGFRNLIRLLKPKGLILCRVYSYLGRWNQTCRREIVSILGNNPKNVDEKIKIAKKLFLSNINELEKRDFYEAYDRMFCFQDKALCSYNYCSPVETTFRIEDILNLLDENDIKFLDLIGLDTNASTYIKDPYILAKTKGLSLLDKLRLIELFAKPYYYFFIGQKRVHPH